MDKSLKVKFGKKLRFERLKRDLSQESLSELSTLHRVIIGQIERAEISTTIDSIEKLAHALKIDPRNLFDFSDIIID